MLTTHFLHGVLLTVSYVIVVFRRRVLMYFIVVLLYCVTDPRYKRRLNSNSTCAICCGLVVTLQQLPLTGIRNITRRLSNSSRSGIRLLSHPPHTEDERAGIW